MCLFNNVCIILKVHAQKFFPKGQTKKIHLNHSGVIMPKYLYSARVYAMGQEIFHNTN